MKILSDLELIEKCDLSVRRRRKVEITIARRVLTDLRAAGHKLAVDDGGDITKSDDDAVLLNALFSVDNPELIASQGMSERRILFIWGNGGHDCITDYSMGLDDIMAPILIWTDEQVEAGNF